MKYNHLRLEILNNFSSQFNKFYFLNGLYCFDLDTIYSQLIMKYEYTKGKEYYNKLLKFADIVSQWPKVILLIVRFHFICLVCQLANDKYFGQNSQRYKFTSNKFVNNSMQSICMALPFSQITIEKLGIAKECQELFEFLKIADQINLFSLSETMMEKFSNNDHF